MDIYELVSIIGEKKKFFQSSNEEIKNENITRLQRKFKMSIEMVILLNCNMNHKVRSETAV